MNLRPILNGLALLLAGCAGGVAAESRYPSLARRPVESRDFDAEIRKREEAQAQAANADIEPSLRADIDRYAQQSQAGASAFDAAYGNADAAVRQAANSSVSSEAWVNAQVALGDLEGKRDESVSALAGLDQLYIDRMNAIADGKVQGGDQVIEAARNSALAVVDAQNDRLDRLKGILRAP